ncbi:uncharacterized protein [Physcomitrium patens]|uniref:Protein kinase domain-containing protein n=1 Tax=Physcomitrium patens TaxID=3218 RepID=A0A2K1K5W1_PHYPA|nr:probable LRR receptor-like serine/threonine-protein kinase At2g24230 [Physcomitrium patens]PNR49166.1 hypothetical protein PHYPA_011062 [Physcomitrium patens]|eukprot:XP_024382535.1 probable LRR receptor-like serine/threonine-protein kinase At2g24230 [Physcomitrella patens]
MMPSRVAVKGRYSSRGDTHLVMAGPNATVVTLLLLTTIVFPGVAAQTPDETHLFNFLKNVLPDFKLYFNTSVPTCDWQGVVTCIGLGPRAQIRTLTLSGRGLNGTILPDTLGALSSLQFLDLSNNLLSGEIPLDIYNLSSLSFIRLAQNRLTGGLSPMVSKLVQLATLDISQNLLSGPLPSKLGDLQFLEVLDLHSNNFSENIPVLRQRNPVLQNLDLSSNQLTGEVPWAFDSLTTLKLLNLSRNSLTGALTWQFERLEGLQTLDISRNALEGQIPGFGNLKKLLKVSLSSNRFNGSVPSSLIGLSDLQDLSVADNRLGGSLPQLAWADSMISSLDCSNNFLNGSVPAELFASPNLVVVRLSGNNFTGALPENVSSKIRELDLHSNNFVGTIPKSIVTLPALEKLELSSNQLGGPLPRDFNGLSSINYLGLARNSFEEGLLPDVTGMTKISYLNLSSCSLGGPIPDSFAALKSLVSLDLSHNHLNGSIPVSLSAAASLESLDLSFNNLTDVIPAELASLASLRHVNFSYNNLSGEVPNSKQWAAFGSASFQGNPHLCGLVLEKPCSSYSPPTPGTSGPHHGRHRRRLLKVGAIIGIVLGSIVLCCGFLTILLLFIKKKPKKLTDREVSKYLSSKLPVTFEADPSTWAGQVPQAGSIPVIMFEKPLLNLTFADLLKATSLFHKDNQISDGGYGPAFKGTLPGGFQIVVKVLYEGGPVNEYEKAAQLESLGRIRHPNLVTLVGYCLVGDERVLVYEFMENGDLSSCLHELPSGQQNPEDWSKDTWENPDFETRNDVLSWQVRHRIALGVARALAFLHHGCCPHLVHRAVTSSNILLDSIYEPHLADSGLGTLTVTGGPDSEAPAYCGSPGYSPPEYGQLWKATTRGDVYSFGVLVLELVTGKKPTSPYYHESYGGNLVGWVRALIREKRGYKCLDPRLASSKVESEMLEALRIGYLCTAEHPSKRPTMQQVVGLLKDIQPEFSGAAA